MIIMLFLGVPSFHEKMGVAFSDAFSDFLFEDVLFFFGEECFALAADEIELIGVIGVNHEEGGDGFSNRLVHTSFALCSEHRELWKSNTK